MTPVWFVVGQIDLVKGQIQYKFLEPFSWRANSFKINGVEIWDFVAYLFDLPDLFHESHYVFFELSHVAKLCSLHIGSDKNFVHIFPQIYIVTIKRLTSDNFVFFQSLLHLLHFDRPLELLKLLLNLLPRLELHKFSHVPCQISVLNNRKYFLHVLQSEFH